MFGSNFPIEKLWTSHAKLKAAHRAAAQGHGDQVEAGVFWKTAGASIDPSQPLTALAGLTAEK